MGEANISNGKIELEIRFNNKKSYICVYSLNYYPWILLYVGGESGYCSDKVFVWGTIVVGGVEA